MIGRVSPAPLDDSSRTGLPKGLPASMSSSGSMVNLPKGLPVSDVSSSSSSVVLPKGLPVSHNSAMQKANEFPSEIANQGALPSAETVAREVLVPLGLGSNLLQEQLLYQTFDMSINSIADSLPKETQVSFNQEGLDLAVASPHATSTTHFHLYEYTAASQNLSIAPQNSIFKNEGVHGIRIQKLAESSSSSSNSVSEAGTVRFLPDGEYGVTTLALDPHATSFFTCNLSACDVAIGRDQAGEIRILHAHMNGENASALQGAVIRQIAADFGIEKLTHIRGVDYLIKQPGFDAGCYDPAFKENIGQAFVYGFKEVDTWSFGLNAFGLGTQASSSSSSSSSSKASVSLQYKRKLLATF